MTEIRKERAAKLIAAALGDDVDDSAYGTSLLRRSAMLQNLKFLD